MMVVSDTSPIRALHHLGLLSLCQHLYGSVVVPEAVRVELRQSTTTCPAIDIVQFSGFEVRRPRATAADFNVPDDLDPGETQAITLALELRADLLLIDERKGTEAARNLKLSTVGVMGVLLDAKRKGQIQQVLPLVDRLVTELKFFVAPALRRRIAELAGE
jgi:uncharacterized protein